MVKQRKKLNWRMAILAFGIVATLVTPLFAFVGTAHASGEIVTWTSGGASTNNAGATVTVSGSSFIPGNVTLTPNNLGASVYSGTFVYNGCTVGLQATLQKVPPDNGSPSQLALTDPNGCANASGIRSVSGTLNKTPNVVNANTTQQAPPGQEQCDATKGLKWDGKTCTATPDADGNCPVGTAIDPSSINPTTAPKGTCTTAAAAKDAPEQDDCPIAKNQELRWLYCPVFYGMSVLTNTLDAFINEYLTTGNKIFDASDSGTLDGKPVTNGYKDAWQTFRNFGIALVVIAGLVMLVSEAFGFDFVDAYTVRKVLPRLLIAIVGISLSWELCKFIVGFFDTLGRAMGSIIYTSFGVGDQGIEIWAVVVANLLVGTAIGAAALLLTGLGLLSMLGTLLLAMLVGAAVLILRQAIIVAAVVLAPLAIAAYILPNTSKLASFWWDTFTRMLMLYPIATGLIALCKVMGKIAMTNPGGTGGRSAIGDLIATVSGIIFFFAGYALLPVAFRLTGGLVATIGGIANDRSRGGFDRLKNFRKGRMEDSMARMQSGERFKGNNALSAGFNNFSKGASAFGKSRYKGAFLRDKSVRATAIAEHDEMMAQQHMKSAAGMGNMFNDDSLRAQASGRTEAEARSNLKKIYGMEGEAANNAIAMAKANGGFSAVRQQSATKQLAATGTGYDDLGQMAQQIAVAANGNQGRIETMVGAMRGAASKSGRYDLGAAGHGTVANLARQASQANGRPNEAAVQSALVEGAMSTTNMQIMQGKPKGTSNFANAISGRLQEVQRTAQNTNLSTEARAAATMEATELVSKINNMKGATSYGTEVNSNAMAINRISVTANEVVRGNVGFEAPGVQQAVQIIHNQTSKTVVDTHPDGSIVRDDKGRPVEVENVNYSPDAARVQNRMSQARGGPRPDDPALHQPGADE